jgi:peptidoglycan hydrolase-like protein with peptidoglycan-binding domain
MTRYTYINLLPHDIGFAVEYPKIITAQKTADILITVPFVKDQHITLNDVSASISELRDAKEDIPQWVPPTRDARRAAIELLFITEIQLRLSLLLTQVTQYDGSPENPWFSIDQSTGFLQINGQYIRTLFDLSKPQSFPLSTPNPFVFDVTDIIYKSPLEVRAKLRALAMAGMLGVRAIAPLPEAAPTAIIIPPAIWEDVKMAVGLTADVLAGADAGIHLYEYFHGDAAERQRQEDLLFDAMISAARRTPGGNHFEALQESLRELHLYYGAIDGLVGPRTQASIDEFARQHGLTNADYRGPRFIRQLARAAAAQMMRDRRSSS